MTTSAPFAIPEKLLKKRLLRYLEEDVGYGDLSSGLIPLEEQGKARILAKSEGIIAGLLEAKLLFKSLGLKIETLKEDGQKVKPSEVVLTIEGNLRDILMAERTALNFLMKLSSIATSTGNLVQKIRAEGYKTRIAATRKVTPGFGWFEKKAAYYGGGDTHRWNLSDMVLLKDTHRKYFDEDPEKMLQNVKKQTSFSKKIEIEIEDPQAVEQAVKNGADIVMLDNMTPKQITGIMNNLCSKGVIFEASGNITHDNIVDYARSGIDVISTSQTILSPHISVDYSLKLF